MIIIIISSSSQTGEKNHKLVNNVCYSFSLCGWYITEPISQSPFSCLFEVPTYEVSKLVVSKEKNKNIDKQHFTPAALFLIINLYFNISYVKLTWKALILNGWCQLVPVAH